MSDNAIAINDFRAAMDACTDKQQAYVWAFLKYANRRKAGKVANYKPGYVDAVHNRPDVQRAIELGQRERWNHLQADAEMVLLELLDIISADPLDAFDENNNLLPLEDWPVALRKRLDSFDVERRFVGRENLPTILSKPRFMPKAKLVELLGKHNAISAFHDTIVVDDAQSFTARLEAARQRRERDITPRPEQIESK